MKTITQMIVIVTIFIVLPVALFAFTGNTEYCAELSDYELEKIENWNCPIN